MRIFPIDVVTPTGLPFLCNFKGSLLANRLKATTALRGVHYQKANMKCAAEGDCNLTPTANHNERMRFDMAVTNIDYSILPVTEDEWIEALTAKDNGHISCVHPGLAQYVKNSLTPQGTLANTRSPFKTPLALSRFHAGLDLKAELPWRGTGWTPSELKAARAAQGEATIHDLGFANATDLYFIGADEGPIKIGVSGHVGKRLQNFQTSYPHKLHILAVIRQGGMREGEFHKKFAEHRMQGEWFARHPALLAEINRINGVN